MPIAFKSVYKTLAVPFKIARKQWNREHIHLRRAGDMARDKENWLEASEFYQRYLALNPAEGAIWVQLGHVRKENGRLNEAAAAYLTAYDLMPRNADLLLHLGHLYKLQGRRGDAAINYAASLELEPSDDAYTELIKLNEIALANKALRISAIRLSPAVYLQVGDLLSYLEYHMAVSGIQRVQLRIIEYIVSIQQEPGATTYHFVYNKFSWERLVLLDNNVLKEIIACLSSVCVDHGNLRRLIVTARRTATPVALSKGDVFVILGSFWGCGGSTEMLRSLKAAGVRTGIYFYDIIPFRNPEFCDDGVAEDFTQALIEVSHFIDFALTISNFTRNEIAHFLQDNSIDTIPLHTVPLAHSLTMHQSRCGLDDNSWPEGIAEFRGKRFVICVSTIEVRKNHLYLFSIWRALIDEGIDIPILLFIGRQGWRVDDLMSQLKATNYLNGRIAILNNISDNDLMYLYRDCLFTTFPSLVEGWGLPVGVSIGFKNYLTLRTNHLNAILS